MSTTLWSDFQSETDVRVTMKYREPYVTEGIDRKMATTTAPGIYRGWKLSTSTNPLKVKAVADTTFSDHVAVQQSISGLTTGHALTITKVGGDFDINLAGLSSTPGLYVIALYGVYTIGAETQVSIVGFSTADWAALTVAEQSEYVVIGTVDVPVSGLIPLANISYDRRSYAWEKKAPEAVEWVPLIKNSSFEEGQLAQTDELAAYFWQTSITTPSTPASTWQLSNSSSHKNTGSRGLLFTYATADSAVTGQVVQYFNVTVTAGDRVRISAYVNGLQAISSGSVYLRLAFTDSAGTVTNQDFNITSDFPTSGFEKFEKTFAVAAGVTALKSAALYLDAVQFLTPPTAAFAVDDFQVFAERSSTASENVLASRLGGVVGASKLMLEAPGAFPGASAGVFGYDSAGSGAVTLQSRIAGSNLGLRLINGATLSGDLTTSKLSTLIGGPTGTPVPADSLHIHGDISYSKLRKNGVISGAVLPSLPLPISGLNFSVGSGYFYVSGFQKYAASAVLTLVNGTTNYVYFDTSSVAYASTVTEGTAYSGSGAIPVARVVTSGGNITEIKDTRRFIDQVDNSIQLTVGSKGNFRTLDGAISWAKSNANVNSWKNLEIHLLEDMTLTESVTVNCDNVIIKGNGATLSWSFADCLFWVMGDNICIDGVNFNCSASSLSARCVYGISPNITIRNCLVTGTPSTLFQTYTTNQRVIVENNKVFSIWYGVFIVDASMAIIRNNQFFHAGAFASNTAGISIFNSQVCDYIVSGNIIKKGDTSSWATGIRFVQHSSLNSANLEISGNAVQYEDNDANNAYLVYIAKDSDLDATANYKIRARVVSNYFYTAATTVVTLVHFEGTNGIISENFIRAPYVTNGTGVRIRGDNNVFSSNTVRMEAQTNGVAVLLDYKTGTGNIITKGTSPDTYLEDAEASFEAGDVGCPLTLYKDSDSNNFRWANITELVSSTKIKYDNSGSSTDLSYTGNWVIFKSRACIIDGNSIETSIANSQAIIYLGGDIHTVSNNYIANGGNCAIRTVGDEGCIIGNRIWTCGYGIYADCITPGTSYLDITGNYFVVFHDLLALNGTARVVGNLMSSTTSSYNAIRFYSGNGILEGNRINIVGTQRGLSLETECNIVGNYITITTETGGSSHRVFHFESSGQVISNNKIYANQTQPIIVFDCEPLSGGISELVITGNIINVTPMDICMWMPNITQQVIFSNNKVETGSLSSFFFYTNALANDQILIDGNTLSATVTSSGTVGAHLISFRGTRITISNNSLRLSGHNLNSDPHLIYIDGSSYGVNITNNNFYWDYSTTSAIPGTFIYSRGENVRIAENCMELVTPTATSAVSVHGITVDSAILPSHNGWFHSIQNNYIFLNVGSSIPNKYGITITNYASFENITGNTVRSTNLSGGYGIRFTGDGSLNNTGNVVCNNTIGGFDTGVYIGERVYTTLVGNSCYSYWTAQYAIDGAAHIVPTPTSHANW